MNSFFNEQIFWDVSLKEYFESKLYEKKAKAFLLIQSPNIIPGCRNFKKLLVGALNFNDIVCPLLETNILLIEKQYPLLKAIQREKGNARQETKENFCHRAKLAANLFPLFHVHVKPLYFTRTKAVFHILAVPKEKISELEWDGKIFTARNPRVAFDNLVTQRFSWKAKKGEGKIKIP